MGIEKSVEEYLREVPEIKSIADDRIYMSRLPEWDRTRVRRQQDQFPAIVLHTTFGENDPTLGGSDTGLGRVAMAIELFAVKYDTVKDLEERVRLNFDTFRGEIGLTDRHFIEDVTLDRGTDFYDATNDKSDIGIHRVSMDAEIHFQQEAPGV